MPDLSVIPLFIQPLERTGIRYMVSGSIASIIYGEPRATLDIDVAVLIQPAEMPSLRSAFPARDYYLPPDEVMLIEMARPARGHFNLIHPASGFKADFYPSRNHPYFPWAMKNRRVVKVLDVSVWLAPPEYVILWKLDFYREGTEKKHLLDIAAMLRVSGEHLDRDLIEKAVAELGLTDYWAAAIEL